jgi:hypothetical protein
MPPRMAQNSRAGTSISAFGRTGISAATNLNGGPDRKVALFTVLHCHAVVERMGSFLAASPPSAVPVLSLYVVGVPSKSLTGIRRYAPAFSTPPLPDEPTTSIRSDPSERLPYDVKNWPVYLL